MAMLEAVGLELRLGLIPWHSNKNCGAGDSYGEEIMLYEKKRVFKEILTNVGDGNRSSDDVEESDKSSSKMRKMSSEDGVVGWPPVRSYRKKMNLAKMYVKVSMDGTPILRKIDLSVHKDYSSLTMALEKLFACFGLGKYTSIPIHVYIPAWENILIFLHFCGSTSLNF